MAIKLIRIKLTANVRCFADNAVGANHIFVFLMPLESLFSANLRRIIEIISATLADINCKR